MVMDLLLLLAVINVLLCLPLYIFAVRNDDACDDCGSIDDLAAGHLAVHADGIKQAGACHAVSTGSSA